MSSLSEKKRELEKRCPGTHFIESVRPDELRFQSPNQYGQIRVFSVNLKEMNQTAEQWLDEEISRHPEPSDRDQYYRVICPVCGPVQINFYCN